MTAPEPRQIRRDAVERLAAAVRALADAAAETDVDPQSLDDITAEIAALTERLAAITTDSPYSGLTWAPGDFSVPEGPMPLNPIIGACSPGATRRATPVLRRRDRRARGVHEAVRRPARLRARRHQRDARRPDRDREPAGHRGAHDHQVPSRAVPAAAPPRRGGRGCGVSANPTATRLQARFTITARDEVAVEGPGELVPFERLAQRADRKNTG